MSDVIEAEPAEAFSQKPEKTDLKPRKPNPVLIFLSAIPRVAFSGIAYLLHPRKLTLTKEQAEYVQALFLGGAMPDEIGRAMNNRYNRKTWPYFQTFNAKTWRYEWTQATEEGAGRVDFEFDGLEYINAALWALGGVVKGYYNPAHPMVQRIAVIAGSQEKPRRKGV